MRALPLVAALTVLAGCLDNRATVDHPASTDLGQTWIGGTMAEGRATAPTTQRRGHQPQEVLADAWRQPSVIPTFSAWLACDRVQDHRWPKVQRINLWYEVRTYPGPMTRDVALRTWARAGDVGSPSTVPEAWPIQRASVVARSPIPVWQWFPVDIAASFTPVDFPSHAHATVDYRTVPPRDVEDFLREAAAAGYLPSQNRTP